MNTYEILWSFTKGGKQYSNIEYADSITSALFKFGHDDEYIISVTVC